MKILQNMQTSYLKLDLERSARIEWSLIAKTINYAFQCVLKGKFSSFYQDQYFPMLKPLYVPKEGQEDQKMPIFMPKGEGDKEMPILKSSFVPKKLLDNCIKERQTFKIKSHAFQRF